VVKENLLEGAPLGVILFIMLANSRAVTIAPAVSPRILDGIATRTTLAHDRFPRET
jgi:hypothetical protein